MLNQAILGTFIRRQWSFRECPLNRFSHVRLFATAWTVACQAPLSMGVSRQEFLNGLPFPSPGDLPDTGIDLCLLCLLHCQVDSLLLMPLGKPSLREYSRQEKSYQAWTMGRKETGFFSDNKLTPRERDQVSRQGHWLVIKGKEEVWSP